MVSLAEDLKLALDRVSFARSISFEPDEWQAEALRSNAPRQLYNASRQSGKSTVAAVLAVHTALYDPGSLVLLVSPTLRQSQELFRKCIGFYAASGKAVPPESETALTLTLENASRIVSLPGGKGHTVRGYSSVRLLVVDEASRVPDELYASLRPMLAVSGGRLIALSTPFGTRGWWYEAWKSAEPWERYHVTAAECPRILPEFLGRSAARWASGTIGKNIWASSWTTPSPFSEARTSRRCSTQTSCPCGHPHRLVGKGKDRLEDGAPNAPPGGAGLRLPRVRPRVRSGSAR